MIETLQTARLVLRPITFDDAPLLFELDRDPEVVRFISGRPSTMDEVRSVIESRLGCRWIATQRADGQFVGWFGLVPSTNCEFDIGYRLRRASWGQGLATEGTQALIDAAFGQLGAQRVTAQTMAVNSRSRHVMERCGMRFVRTFHLEWDDPLPGTEQGEVEYEITRQMWSAKPLDRA